MLLFRTAPEAEDKCFCKYYKIVSDFNMKISYLVMIYIKDPQMHTQEVVQGVRKEHTVQ